MAIVPQQALSTHSNLIRLKPKATSVAFFFNKYLKEVIMNDKDWLEKISIAYKAYPYPSKETEAFIAWIYKQYGIEYKKAAVVNK
jgi:hypothetical protein